MPIQKETDHYVRVKELCQRAGQDTPTTIVLPDEETRLLRAKLILEECFETVRALGFKLYDNVSENGIGVIPLSLTDIELRPEYGPDLEEIADGCADIHVVTTGTLVACGIPDKELLELVDENNLNKFGEGHSYDEYGKLIKPPGHKPPDIGGLLSKLKNGKDKE